MKNYWFMVLRYLLAGEDSRPGFQDYWQRGFLAGHTLARRRVLESAKVALLLAMIFSGMAWLFPV